MQWVLVSVDDDLVPNPSLTHLLESLVETGPARGNFRFRQFQITQELPWLPWK